MRRSIEQWAGPLPSAVNDGSEAQDQFIKDAQADIAELARQVEQLEGAAHVPSEDPADAKVVVGIGPPSDEALHATILLGVPVDAWHYMKDGKKHVLDLREAGVPVQIRMFGGTDHANIIETLQMATDNTGKPLLATDQEIQDLGINVPANDEGG